MAFITDVFSRYIVGWQVSTTLRAELALDALEMAIWAQTPSLCRTSGRGADRLVCRIRKNRDPLFGRLISPRRRATSPTAAT